MQREHILHQIAQLALGLALEKRPFWDMRFLLSSVVQELAMPC